MKQSNIDYKHTYYFKDAYSKLNSEDNPSITKDTDINVKLKENPYKANVEVEKNEIVLTPDLTALHKAGGKRHSQGGTQVYLKPDSFVFSDDKNLAFDKQDYELFELKETAQKRNPQKHTPAKVLEKNVPLKDYNRMMTNLSDDNKDFISKQSSELMLNKYLNTIGQIAFVQEGKKNFPQGVPEFAMNTAPVYDGDLKNELDGQKQYMKYGGTIGNPKMQGGGSTPSIINIVDERGRRVIIDTTKTRGSSYLGTVNGKPFSIPKAQLPYYMNLYNVKANLTMPKDAVRPIFTEVTGVPNYGPAPAANTSNPSQPPAPTFNPVAFASALGTRMGARGVEALSNKTSNTKPVEEDIATQVANGAVSAKGNAGRLRDNPYSGSTAGDEWGLWQGDKLSTFKDKFGVTNAADKITDLDALANQLGYTGPKNNKAFQEWLYNSSPERKIIIDKWHEQYGNPLAGNKFDGKIGIRWQNALKELTQQPTGPKFMAIDDGKSEVVNTPAPQYDPLKPGSGETQAENGVPINWEFTPWQKKSQLHNLGKWASVKREMPYRSRYNATEMQAEYVNPEQAVGDIKAAFNSKLNANKAINPILWGADAQMNYGQGLGAAASVRGQYDNQNVQIANSTRQYNNQVKNQESMVNMQNDQQYWREAATGRQNFQNMRTYLGDNYMNNVMRDVETNQKLAYNLATLGPKPAYGFDFKTGNFYRNDKNILDVQSSMVGDNMSGFLEGLEKSGLPAEKIWDLKTKILLGKYLGTNMATQNYFGRSSYTQKKGGTIKPNPYKK